MDSIQWWHWWSVATKREKRVPREREALAVRSGEQEVREKPSPLAQGLDFTHPPTLAYKLSSLIPILVLSLHPHLWVGLLYLVLCWKIKCISYISFVVENKQRSTSMMAEYKHIWIFILGFRESYTWCMLLWKNQQELLNLLPNLDATTFQMK